MFFRMNAVQTRMMATSATMHDVLSNRNNGTGKPIISFESDVEFDVVGVEFDVLLSEANV